MSGDTAALAAAAAGPLQDESVAAVPAEDETEPAAVPDEPSSAQPGGSTAPWFTALKDAVESRNAKLAEWCWDWVVPGQTPAEVTFAGKTKRYLVCACCKVCVQQSDGAALMCGNVDHFHCAQCLEVMALDCMRLSINRRLVDIDDACKDVIPGMVTCSVCRHPSLLGVQDVEVTTEFQPARPFRKRTTKVSQVVVDAQATNMLTYHVDEIYQNERRSWMGKFGKENLLLADNRGPWSNEDGSTKVKARSDIRCPNPVYHWIGDWKFESTKRNDANGWEYALNWPGETVWWGNSRWAPEPGPTRFVRRRKWRRLRLRLSEDDILLLSTVREKADYWVELFHKLLHEEY